MSYSLTFPVRRRSGLGLISPSMLQRWGVNALPIGVSRPIIFGPALSATGAQPVNLVPPAPRPVAPSGASPVTEPVPVSSLPSGAMASAPASTSSVTAVASQPNSASVSIGPPSTWPTDQPYTDAAGNVWNWNAQTGWQISAPANAGSAISSAFSSIASWLTSNSLLSSFGFSFPNWGVLAAAAVGGALLLGGQHHGGRHRR